MTKVPNEDVVILVSSLHRLAEMGRLFTFTDRHAYLVNAEFYNDLKDLDKIDWPILQKKDFRRDPDDPGKIERYQAEALVHEHLPVDSFLGVACYSDTVRDQLLHHVERFGIDLKVVTQKGWYL